MCFIFKRSPIIWLRYDIDICKVNNLNSRIKKPLKEKKFALLTFVNRSIIYGYYQYVEMNNINRTDRSVFELLWGHTCIILNINWWKKSNRRITNFLQLNWLILNYFFFFFNYFFALLKDIVHEITENNISNRGYFTLSKAQN